MRGTSCGAGLFLLLTAAACGGPAGGRVATEPPPIQITLQPAASRALPAHISVSGLDSATLTSLRRRPPADAEWPSLLRVFVDRRDVLAGSRPSEGAASGTEGDASADPVPPVQGRYAVSDSAITFTPLFPFDPGRQYRVVFDPSHLPQSHQATVVATLVQLPAIATEPSTVVTAIHPSADVVPENLLRIYIEFSAPMGNGAGVDFVKLVELSGPDGKTERADNGAFLPVEANFWSPDHTRYTLFFDPGRVKDGILPNRQTGRPLVAGHRYALDVSRTWTDANGLPLKIGYRHLFRAGRAVNEPLRPSDWKVNPPRSGTREPLVATFPRPLDHGILMRAVEVEAAGRRRIDGDVELESHDTVWRFTPVAPWQSGEYNLVAQSFLEDPEGNQIGRAFETAGGEPRSDDVPESDAGIRIPFTIGAP
jgi:hypothetical protein